MSGIESFAVQCTNGILTEIRLAAITGMEAAPGGGCIVTVSQRHHVVKSLPEVLALLARPLAAVPVTPIPTSPPPAPPAEAPPDAPKPASQVDTDPRPAEERLAEARAAKRFWFIVNGARFLRPGDPGGDFKPGWTVAKGEADRWDNQAEAERTLAEWAASKGLPDGTKVERR